MGKPRSAAQQAALKKAQAASATSRKAITGHRLNQSIGSMGQKDKVAKKHGMTQEQFKAKMARDRRALTAELKRKRKG